MDIEFSVRDAVEKRCSVRTYDPRPVEAEVREKILACAETLQNPLGPRMRVQFIEKTTAAGGEKLGTYGVIRGARLYLGAAIEDDPHAPEALGYDFERLVLYMTQLGLGTCWLGGTFTRGAFAAAMALRPGELFPIVTPVGYAAARPRVTETLFRRSLKADARQPWAALFFAEDFSRPLTEADAGDYHFPLEMLRRAPSATNGQPWRVLRADGAFHFFEKRGAAARVGAVDMQRIDVGIGVCHFHLAALERGLPGHFARLVQAAPAGMDYITSWVME